MNCPNCGNEIYDNQNFCKNCGRKLTPDDFNPDNKADEPSDFHEDNNNRILKQVIVVICAIIGILIFIFAGIKYKQYQQDISPLERTLSFYPNSEVIMTVKYDEPNKQAKVTMQHNGTIIEQWQLDYIEEHEDVTGELEIVAENRNENLDIVYKNAKIFVGQPLVFNYKIENVNTPKKFVRIKEILSIANLKASYPYFLVEDKQLREQEKQRWLKQRELIAQDNAAKEIAYTWAFTNVDGEAVPVDFNPRKCLFKVKGICFGHPFFVKGMSYEDCKANKNKLGIDSCKESEDLFASTAYVCGGVKNMPTPDELVILTQDLYNDMSFDNIKNPDGCSGSFWYVDCNYRRATRIEKPYIEYFRETYWNNQYFNNRDAEEERKNLGLVVISNLPYSEKKIYARVFNSNGSGLGLIDRYRKVHIEKDPAAAWSKYAGQHPFSLCVERQQSKTVTNKYPIKTKTYDEDVENDLF